MNDSAPRILSPCIGVCRLDERSICLGCGRLIGEIAEWSTASDARRRMIAESARERRDALQPAPEAQGNA